MPEIEKYDHSKRSLADALNLDDDEVKMLDDKIQQVLNVVSKHDVRRSERVEAIQKIIMDINDPKYNAFILSNIASFLDAIIHKIASGVAHGIMVEIEKKEKEDSDDNITMYQ